MFTLGATMEEGDNLDRVNVDHKGSDKADNEVHYCQRYVLIE